MGLKGAQGGSKALRGAKGGSRRLKHAQRASRGSTGFKGAQGWSSE